LALTPGTRLGPYEILAAIGAGGMGEVYKARDSRLTRTVAIKVLPAHAAADVAARARFERESRAIATLSHPHICVVYDVGRQGDIDYLVMELLEGETLADRLAKTKGPLPLDQVLGVGIAIADALDKAHRAGIVHRDLKPANVMLTKTGPKLLDFGLAKLRGAASPVSLSDETGATTAGPGTATGTILGTIHYMAPEQVEGREADTRSDIWALGALLYEMATGRRPFEGESAANIVGAILKDAPPALSARQPMTPPMLERIIHKCLAKDPDRRWQSVSDLGAELEWVQQGGMLALGPAKPARTSGRERIAWIAAVAALMAAAVFAVPAMRHVREMPPLPQFETRVDIVTPTTDDPTSFALSPDGRRIVFAASADGVPRLWLRSLGVATSEPLPGTEGGLYPFWSPDGRSIGFFASNALKRLELGGGAAQALAPVIVGRGGSWSADGVIVFGASRTSGLMRVSSSGGDVTAVTAVGPHQAGHASPYFLPDGQRFLFFVTGAADMTGVYLGSLDGSTPTRLTPADGAGVYLAEGPGAPGRVRGDGWLLWVRAGTLVAQRLDLAHAALAGDPETLADGVAVDTAYRSGVSAAPTGLVAYRTGGGSRRQLLWRDRAGTSLGSVGAEDTDLQTNPRVSEDGRRVVMTRTVQGNADIWMLDGSRTVRLTFDPALDGFPLWSPDGSRVAFRSQRMSPGTGDIFLKATGAATSEERVITSNQLKTPNSWSPDGRFLLFHSTDPESNTDLWVAPTDKGGAPWVFLRTPFREAWGVFSPNGRWIAYMSNESGRQEIYVRPFAPVGSVRQEVEANRGAVHEAQAWGQWQISNSGGIHPAWRPDGKELYYLNPSGTMMAVPIAVSGDTIEPGAPVTLFPTRILGGGADIQLGRQYDVAPDGRFLINTVLDTAAAPITLIQNWQPDRKQ
jgi:eukaryotic-like serine/threonine-protein kinase